MLAPLATQIASAIAGAMLSAEGQRPVAHSDNVMSKSSRDVDLS